MSMKMRINNGESLEITDDNKTIVSKGIAEEITQRLTQHIEEIDNVFQKHNTPFSIKD